MVTSLNRDLSPETLMALRFLMPFYTMKINYGMGLLRRSNKKRK
jgi:hypothetical protein